MPSFFRVMVVVGLATLVPAVVVLWRQSTPPSTMTTPSTGSSPLSQNKTIGRSALSHGGPATVPTVPNQALGGHGDFEPGQTVSFRRDDASAPTEVVIAKRDVRQLPDGRMEDLYEVRFPDDTTAWVPRQSLLVSDTRNEQSTKER